MGKLVLIAAVGIFVMALCSTEPIEPGGPTVAHVVADALNFTDNDKAHAANRRLVKYYSNSPPIQHQTSLQGF